MKSIIYKLFFFAFLSSFSLEAQQLEDKLTLTKIHFSGLKNTDESYLRKVILSEEGSLLNAGLIDQDIQNLKNLPSIIQAEALLDSSENNVQLTFNVTERNTILPKVNLGTLRNNFWFTLGLSENNFRGIGDKLLAFYQNNDGRHSGQIQFEKFRLGGTKWGAALNAYHWSSIEPLYFEEGPVSYNYDNTGIGGTLVRNFSVRRNLLLGSTLFREGYTQRDEQVLENPPGPKQFAIDKLLSKLQWNQNELNYHFFYLNGYQLNVTYQNVYSLKNPVPFNSIELRLKGFLVPESDPKINFAGRLIVGLSTNDDSPFAPFVADSHVNLRGVGNRIDRGTGQVVLNAEMRYTLKHEENWAVQWVMFTDFGSWRNPGGELSDFVDVDQFRQFVGVGARLLYLKVYGATLRLDYGIDIFNIDQQGFVLGLGQYF